MTSLSDIEHAEALIDQTIDIGTVIQQNSDGRWQVRVGDAVIENAELNPSILGEQGNISGEVGIGDEVILISPNGRLDGIVYILGAVAQLPTSENITAEVDDFPPVSWDTLWAFPALLSTYIPFFQNPEGEVKIENLDINPSDAARLGGTKPFTISTYQEDGTEYEWQFGAERIDITRYLPGDRGNSLGWQWVDYPLIHGDGVLSIPDPGVNPLAYYTHLSSYPVTPYTMPQPLYVPLTHFKNLNLASFSHLITQTNPAVALTQMLRLMAADAAFEFASNFTRTSFHHHNISTNSEISPFRLWWRVSPLEA